MTTKSTRAAEARSVPPTSGDDLDRLLGYIGSIKGTPLEDALDEQRRELGDAQAIVEMCLGALKERFGDWPADQPQYNRALGRVVKILGDAADALEASTLEDRALAIAREKESKKEVVQ